MYVKHTSLFFQDIYSLHDLNPFSAFPFGINPSHSHDHVIFQPSEFNLFLIQYDDATYTNRTDFIDQRLALQSQPLPPGVAPKKYTVLDTLHDCHTIWFRWRENSKPIPLFGLNELYVINANGTWQFTKSYGEFNNAAVLYDSNQFPCPGNATARKV